MNEPTQNYDGERTNLNLRGASILMVVLLMVGGVAWFVLDPGTESADRSATPSLSGADGVVQPFPPGARAEVASFRARLLDGGSIDSSELRGAVTVVNVWGSWCGPCREEAPILAQLSRDTSGQGVRFLGVNVRDNPDAARAFERAFEVPYPSTAPEDSAEVLLAFGGTLAAAAVPTTVVVDPSGAVTARVVGAVSAPTLRALIDDALANTGAS